MTISIALANNILGYIFGDAHGAALPASFAVGLSSTAPAAGGTNITEPSGGGYARATVANTTANWTTSGGQTSNAAVINFPTATASWGAVSYWVLFDGSGTYLASGQITGAPITVGSGSQPSFPIGSLVITEA